MKCEINLNEKTVVTNTQMFAEVELQDDLEEGNFLCFSLNQSF